MQQEPQWAGSPRHHTSPSLYYSNYYNSNRFPIKTSLQHFFNAKKLKQRTDQIRRDAQHDRIIDFIETKAQIEQAHRNYVKPPSVPKYRKAASSAKVDRKRSATETMPELSIEREPIRRTPECSRRDFLHSSLIILSGKSRKFFTPSHDLSKSTPLPYTQDNYYITQSREFSPSKTNKTPTRIKSMSGQMRPRRQKLGISQSRKHKFSPKDGSKRSNRSDEHIKGWDVKNMASINREEYEGSACLLAK